MGGGLYFWLELKAGVGASSAQQLMACKPFMPHTTLRHMDRHLLVECLSLELCHLLISQYNFHRRYDDDDENGWAG